MRWQQKIKSLCSGAKKNQELSPAQLYMLLEIAIKLVITANIIIVAPVILSRLEDMPWTSLIMQTKEKVYNLARIVVGRWLRLQRGRERERDYLIAMAPGKMNARKTAEVDPRNWKKYQIFGMAIATK